MDGDKSNKRLREEDDLAEASRRQKRKYDVDAILEIDEDDEVVNDVAPIPEGGEYWHPPAQLVPYIDNSVFLGRLYPILPARTRATLSSVNRDFAELNRRFALDPDFSKYIVSSRIGVSLDLLPRLPSLLVFETRRSLRNPYGYQASFSDKRSVTVRPFKFLSSAPGTYPTDSEECCTVQSVWPSVGSKVITTSRTPEAEGYVGQFDIADDFRWVPTPHSRSPRVLNANPNQFIIVALAGRRVVKLLQDDNNGRPFVRGVYYEVDSNEWFSLPTQDGPLYRNTEMIDATRLIHGFQWQNNFYVVGHRIRDGTSCTCNFDFTTRTWTEWNATRHQRAVNFMLVALYRAAHCNSNAVQLVSSVDGSILYAVAPAHNYTSSNPSLIDTGRVAVFYLRIDPEIRPHGFQWVRVKVPPLNDRHVYVFPKAWALEGSRGIVVVASIFNQKKKLAWWFLDHLHGVFKRGRFVDFKPKVSTRATFALVHGQVN